MLLERPGAYFRLGTGNPTPLHNPSYDFNDEIIPAGVRVSGDFVHYFLTDKTVVLYAGSLSVDVTATAENGGAEYNDIAPGELTPGWNTIKVKDIGQGVYWCCLHPPPRRNLRPVPITRSLLNERKAS